MDSFQGKTVVITGGSRGMGAEMVRGFAQAGATVVFTYAKSSKEADALVADVKKAGGKAEAVQADARNPDALAKVFADLGKRLKGVDVLINNAGVFTDTVMGADNAADNFEQMFAVNVRSVFQGTNALIPHLRDGGRVINVGSVMGQSAMWPSFSGYAASKYAVAGLTSGWAYDLAARKITVNAIEPGPVDTDMNPANGEMAKEMLKSIPLGRYGKASEVANLALFLASDKAAFITGARISIGGGVHA